MARADHDDIIFLWVNEHFLNRECNANKWPRKGTKGTKWKGKKIAREGREVSEGGEGEEGSSSLADYTGQGPKKLTRSNFSAKGALHTSLGQRPKLEVEKTVEG